MFNIAFANCILKLYFHLPTQIVKYINRTHFQLTYHLMYEWI